MNTHAPAPATDDPATFPKADEPKAVAPCPDGIVEAYRNAFCAIYAKAVLVVAACKGRVPFNDEVGHWRELDEVLNRYPTMESGFSQLPSAGTEQKERGEPWPYAYGSHTETPAERIYRKALERIAGNESDTNREQADGMAITALEEVKALAPTDGTTTPRTSKAVVWMSESGISNTDKAPVVRADFARQLERELNAAKTECHYAARNINNLNTERDEALRKLESVTLENRLRKEAHARLVEVLPAGDTTPANEQVADLTARLALTEKRLGEAQDLLSRANDTLRRGSAIRATGHVGEDIIRFARAHAKQSGEQT